MAKFKIIKNDANTHHFLSKKSFPFSILGSLDTASVNPENAVEAEVKIMP